MMRSLSSASKYVDQTIENRSKAVEEGLSLWRRQQMKEQLRNSYQNRSKADIEFEKEWIGETQEQAIAAWDEFPWDESK